MLHVFRFGGGSARNLLISKNLCNSVRAASKVPRTPVLNELFSSDSNASSTEAPIEFDGKLLETLSLVDLDSEKTVAALRSSIQFANKIELIETDESVQPLYTVLEDQHLYLRADEVTVSNQRKAVLANAKITEEDYFVAPPGNIPLGFDDTEKSN